MKDERFDGGVAMLRWTMQGPLVTNVGVFIACECFEPRPVAAECVCSSDARATGTAVKSRGE